MNYRQYLIRPLLEENPITVQVLGLCSALAVSRSLRPALIMAASVFCVLVFSNLAVSLLRGVLPRSIRLILEVTIIASAVIVVDETLKAYAPDISQVLSVFVGLIITNCIVLGRAEAFAMRHGPLESVADAVGNGAAYAGILLAGGRNPGNSRLRHAAGGAHTSHHGIGGLVSAQRDDAVRTQRVLHHRPADLGYCCLAPQSAPQSRTASSSRRLPI